VSIAGRTLVKFAVKQLKEVVLEPMHRMHDQDKKVLKLQSKVDREKEVCETLKKTVSTVCHNLVLREQELKVLRKRAEEQSIRNKEEVYLPSVCSAMMITSEYRQCIEMVRRAPWG
jgi:citrate lyase gamma subunit